jgi:two-component system sensor histidine kinase RegB
MIRKDLPEGLRTHCMCVPGKGLAWIARTFWRSELYAKNLRLKMWQIVAPGCLCKPVKWQAMNHSLLSAQTGHTQLRRLFWLRNVALAAQCAALLLVYQFFSHNLPWLPLLSAIAFLALLNVLSWWRLSLDYPVSNTELLLQLVADVGVLTALLYYSGGSTNPFVSLYLLPLVIAAATLPRLHTWLMAILTLSCYSLLMLWYVPLPLLSEHTLHNSRILQAEHLHSLEEIAAPSDYCITRPEGSAAALPSAGNSAFNTHIMGMWLGFMISVMVVAYFVVEMARAVRERDAQLTRVREETLRNERIVALGMQAAGAAHELGTPLSTLAVVIGELRHDSAALPEWRDSLTLLDGQVRACRGILDKLLANAQDNASASAQALDQFLAETLNEWQLLRPTAPYTFTSTGAQPAPQMRIDPALRAALMNLLNNAADASPQGIDIHARWDSARFALEIRDHGPGLTASAAARVGTAFFTTKENGRGLGFFLANATVEKMGGSVRLYNREEGGATTEVTIPLVRTT